MALMLGKLYEALVAAGVEQTVAREAAEEVADRDLIEIQSVQQWHTWMLGAVIVLNVVILVRLILA